jgi:hypothetical protein
MRSLLPLLLCWLGAAVTSCTAYDERLSHVYYMGEQIPLAKSYADPREYKDDPENLDPREIPRVERLLRSAPFGPAFLNADALLTGLSRLSFPGYGSFYAHQLGAHLDPELELVYVEIPKRGLNRYVVLQHQSDDSLQVVSDFVAADRPEIVRVHRRAGVLIYQGTSGVTIVPVPQ